MLRVESLTKRFPDGSVALDGVSFDVADGEICTLIGPNGAGKTTTMHCLVDLVRPDRGTASVDGVVVAREPVEARRRIAYLPEHVALYPALTGRENVRFFVRLGGRHGYSLAESADALVRLDISAGAIDRPVRTYSKGMRQKVGLAIAVARGARNLILDEPTSGLDPTAATELMTTLRALADDGCAVLGSSHDLARAERVTNRVVCLDRGRVRAEAITSAVGDHGLEPWYVGAFLDRSTP